MFDGQPDPQVIDFGVGQPSADLLPVDLLKRSSRDFFEVARPLEFNYGELQGDRRFRESLAGLLAEEYGNPTDPDELFLTGGNSQALDYVCERFTQPGDTVFVEEPSYFLAFRIFADHRLKMVGIPVDEHGLDLGFLERALASHSPRLVYTIPSFHNPGGQCLDASRRERLVELSGEHGFLVVADEAYQMLWYRDPPPPALGTLAGQGQVVSLGTFSKILAPGLRLGWIQTDAERMRRLLDSGALRSGGNFNHFTSHCVRHAIDAGLQAVHIRELRRQYGRRLEAMATELDRHFSDMARWFLPAGGYFFWLEFPPGFDATGAHALAREHGAGFQPGPAFSSGGGLSNCMRLSFAHYDEEAIRDGVTRLAGAVRATLRSARV